MSTLRVAVIFPSAVLPNLPENAVKMFVFSGVGSNANGTGAFGNIGRTLNNPGSLSNYNLRNPKIAGAISVTPMAAITFDSHDLKSDASLVGQLSQAIESGYIQIDDTSNPGVFLTRTDLEAFV